MSQGQWFGTSSLHISNYKILLTELAAVIKDMKTHQQPDEVNKLAVKVATWIVNEVINRPVIDALNGLQGTFASLIDDDLIGAGSGVEYCKDMVNLIESLARASVSQPKSMPDLSQASVSKRTKFRTSRFYRHYVFANVETILVLAKAASGPARMELMRFCKDVPGLSAGMQTTIQVVSTLFDESIPLQTRIEFMAQDEQNFKLALDWDTDGIIGMAGACPWEKSDLTGKSHLVFEEFAKFVIKTTIGEKNYTTFFF